MYTMYPRVVMGINQLSEYNEREQSLHNELGFCNFNGQFLICQQHIIVSHYLHHLIVHIVVLGLGTTLYHDIILEIHRLRNSTNQLFDQALINLGCARNTKRQASVAK